MVLRTNYPEIGDSNMSNDNETKSPLIPSLLYTQGDENVKQSETDDLKVPDPAPEVAQAAIAGHTCTDKGASHG